MQLVTLLQAPGTRKSALRGSKYFAELRMNNEWLVDFAWASLSGNERREGSNYLVKYLVNN